MNVLVTIRSVRSSTDDLVNLWVEVLDKCHCNPGFLLGSETPNCYPRCPFGSWNYTSSPQLDCACPNTHKKYGGYCLKKCRNRRDCDDEADCVLHEGHYVCACPGGFKLDHAKKQCIDVDECRSRRRRCHANDVCTNLPGGSVCLNFECDQGFTPLTGLGRCLKEGNGKTHFMRKAAIGLLEDIKENQVFSTTKLPKAYKLELSKLRISPEDYVGCIKVCIQSKDDGTQELIMESIKSFPRSGIATIDVIAETPEKAFIYELRTKLYVSRYPLIVDIIGYD